MAGYVWSGRRESDPPAPLVADHAPMGVLVWTMAVAGAALAIALTLAWRARWLALLAPWVRR